MHLGKLGINGLKFTTEGVAALPENFYKIHKLEENRKHDKIFTMSHHLTLRFSWRAYHGYPAKKSFKSYA